MINLKIPDLDEVIEAANKKGLKPSHIAKSTGLSTETTSKYFKGGRVSTRSLETIINYINNYGEGG